MRRTNVFLIILIVSLASLISLMVIGFAVFASGSQYPSNWFSDMWSQMSGTGMGGMMGGTEPTPVQNPALPYFGVTFVVLIGVTIVGVVGLAYFLAFPEFRTGVAPVICDTAVQGKPVEQTGQSQCTPLESVVKTLTDEERKVIEVLKVHDGKYLQKYIRKEAGLSRLKTHRILARFSERGLVTLEKTGNTNQVSLASWLRQ
jgi:predicted transcriptional regulator